MPRAKANEARKKAHGRGAKAKLKDACGIFRMNSKDTTYLIVLKPLGSY